MVWPWTTNPRALGRAWLLLTATLAGHIIDEVMNDFLSAWNPMVGALRERVGILLLPTFTSDWWILPLVLAVLVLLALTKLAYRRREWVRRFAFFYAIVMIAHGLFHITWSFMSGDLVSGVYSSPFLIATGLYLLMAARHAKDVKAIPSAAAGAH